MSKHFSKADVRFLLIVLIAHVAWFCVALHYGIIYNGDSPEYVNEAFNIKDRSFFYSGDAAMPIQPELMTQRQPLYPFFLLLVYMFGAGNWVVLVLQNIISILNIWLLRRTLFRIGYNAKFDWLLLLFLLLYPAQFVHTNCITPDILVQTSVLLYVHFFIRLWQERAWRHGWYMTLALTAGLFIKPVLYPFVILHIALLLALAAYFRKGFLRAVGISTVPLLCVLAYCLWNGQRTGKVHFSSNQSFNAIYYYYFYIGKEHGTDSARSFINAERAHIATLPTFKQQYDYANQRGVTLLKQEFAPYMAYHLQRGARMVIDPGKGELDLFVGELTLETLYTKPPPGISAMYREKGMAGVRQYIAQNPTAPIAIIVLLGNLLRLAGLLLFFFSKRIDVRIRLFVLGLIVYFIVTTGPIANTRYFLPVSLLAMGCATLGIAHALQRWRNKANITS